METVPLPPPPVNDDAAAQARVQVGGSAAHENGELLQIPEPATSRDESLDLFELIHAEACC